MQVEIEKMKEREGVRSSISFYGKIKMRKEWTVEMRFGRVREMIERFNGDTENRLDLE